MSKMDKVWAALEDRDLELGPEPAVAAPNPYQHWRLTRDRHDVAWAVLDRHGPSANTLNTAVLVELDAILDRLAESQPKGLVIRSAKRSGFVAGADISEFVELKTAEGVARQIGRAHEVIDRLERLTIPTIAVIHGYALGGGLELALACHTRIAVTGASFGFPEVQLGLHPGLGGVARMTRLIDPIEAMSAMLTGRTIHDRKAKALGLVDAIVPERHVLAAVEAAVSGKLHGARSSVSNRLKESAPARNLAARQMRAQAEAKAPHAHYPAPFALIDLWEKHGGDFEAMKRAEIGSFAELLVSETSRNLVRVFFLREKMKKAAGKPPETAHVHVIGAGAMGGDIAAWCAWKGLTVTLGDVDPKPIGGAIRRAAALYEKIGHKDGIKVRDALDRLIPDVNGEGIARADLVIEAAPEKAELKAKIYAAVEPRMKPGAVLATNTSSIPLQKLAETLQRPERFVGLHFFNPVSKMQLVEVVRHDKLDAEVEAFARGFAGLIDRLPAPAKSAPGFIVNRALTPYLAEALILMDEGVAPEVIDKAAEMFGMPVGPIELADQVGLDVALAVADSLKRDLGWAIPDAPDWLRKKVADGHLGRKTGQGLYVWRDGEAVKAKTGGPSPYLADRLVLPMLNACVAILREGVAADEDTVDGAMIFGSGFAPFRGGPMHYARTRGPAEIRARLVALAEAHGERFAPDAGWAALDETVGG